MDGTLLSCYKMMADDTWSPAVGCILYNNKSKGLKRDSASCPKGYKSILATFLPRTTPSIEPEPTGVKGASTMEAPNFLTSNLSYEITLTCVSDYVCAASELDGQLWHFGLFLYPVAPPPKPLLLRLFVCVLHQQAKGIRISRHFLWWLMDWTVFVELPQC